MDQSIIAQLKQTNVSKDPEKTKVRTDKLWKSIDTAAQKKVLAFLELKVTSIYRAYHKGNISAKIVVALSQICDINPYYLTGESDEPSESSDEILTKFLTDKGYGKLFEKPASAKRKNKKSGIENMDIPEKAEESQEEIATVSESDVLSSDQNEMDQNDIAASVIAFFFSKYDKIAPEQLESVQNLSLDDIDTLVKALFIKSKAMGKDTAVNTLIKLLLIS